MLILTRRAGESLMIGEDVSITVLGVKGNQVRIGIEARTLSRVAARASKATRAAREQTWPRRPRPRPPRWRRARQGNRWSCADAVQLPRKSPSASTAPCPGGDGAARRCGDRRRRRARRRASSRRRRCRSAPMTATRRLRDAHAGSSGERTIRRCRLAHR